MSLKAVGGRTSYPVRVLAGLAVVAALSLFESLSFEESAHLANQTQPDPYGVRAQEERFRPALSLLPRDAIVGYFSDLPEGRTAATGAYFVAQYWLAPRILVPIASAGWKDWAMGNFSKPQNYQAAGAQYHLTVVQDCGNGVVLYRKQP